MRPFFYLICILMCASCGNSTGDCRFGSPQAIFSEDLPGVAAHSFEAKGQKASESLQFENGLLVELLQSGCNDVHQEFRFHLNNEEGNKTDEYWKDRTIEGLRFLGNLSPKQNALLLWVQELEAQKSGIHFGEKTELQPLIFVKVDRIKSGSEVMLLLELSQESPE